MIPAFHLEGFVRLSAVTHQSNKVLIGVPKAMPPNNFGSVLAAFEANIDKNRRYGGATSKTFLNNIAAQRTKAPSAETPPQTISVVPRSVSPPQEQLPATILPEVQKPAAARSILRKDGRYVATAAPPPAANDGFEEPMPPSAAEVPKRTLTKPNGSKRRLVRRKSGGSSKKLTGRSRSRSIGKGPPARRSKSLGAKSRQATDEMNGLLMDQIKRSKEIMTDISSVHSRNSGYVFGDEGSYVDHEDHTYSSVGTFDFNGSSVGFDQSHGAMDDDDDDDDDDNMEYTVPMETPREHRQGLFERMKHWSENEYDSDV